MNSTGRYKPYPAYKDSGVQWLGEVPEGWGLKRLKYAAQCKSGKGIVSEQIEESGEYPVYGGNGIRGFFDEYTHEGEYVLIGRQGAQCGNVHLVKGKFWASEHAVVSTPAHGVNAQWLYMLLHSMNLNQYSESAAQPGLAVDAIVRISVPFPPLPEQTAIAAFLDRETGRIDALIAKKKRLIELLAEKRAAVISVAVTKGLDPDAPMKDSGVEWLGEVPEHWEVLHLKQVFSDVIYGISEVADVEGNFEMLTMGDINEGVVTCPQKRFVDHVDRKLLLRDGDLLFNRTNSLDLIGKVGVFEGGDNVTFASYLVRLRFTDDSTPYYFNYLLNTPTILARARVVALPSIGQANLNPNRYGYIVVCKPPKSEQIQIVQYLENEVEKLKSLIIKNQIAIAKLQEYRTALITAAVTGKIDVRGETEA